MIIRKLEEVRKTGVDREGVQGIAKQLVIGSGDGVPGFSFRVFTVEPGGHSPHHSHGVEHLNYVISGQGALMDGEDRAHPLVAEITRMASIPKTVRCNIVLRPLGMS